MTLTHLVVVGRQSQNKYILGLAPCFCQDESNVKECLVPSGPAPLSDCTMGDVSRPAIFARQCLVCTGIAPATSIPGFFPRASMSYFQGPTDIFVFQVVRTAIITIGAPKAVNFAHTARQAKSRDVSKNQRPACLSNKRTC